MGLGFVLAFWGVIGSVLAGVGALLLRCVAARLTKGSANRERLVRAATLFPIACLIWAGAVFVFQGAVNRVLLHRDAGIGDGFDCPLPNGYALSFIDITDIGTLYKQGSHLLWNGTWENAINDVVVMELAGSYVLGGPTARGSNTLRRTATQRIRISCWTQRQAKGPILSHTTSSARPVSA
jgi:hypothetical protein